jgi:hypothetical protein
MLSAVEFKDGAYHYSDVGEDSVYWDDLYLQMEDGKATFQCDNEHSWHALVQ